MLTGFLDSIFGFLLNWPPYLAIIFLSFVISLLIVIIYRFMTNQDEMKRLKGELKEYQKKMKATRDDPDKLMKIQKEAMSINMQYMSKSMKPTLITFLPILLLFGWMNAHFAYAPLTPGEEFTLTAQLEEGINSNVSIDVPEGLAVVGPATKEITDGYVSFALKGEAGEYYATLEHEGKKQDKRILITEGREYASVSESYNEGVFERIELSNERLIVAFGLTWIWIYIICAILFSTTLRKALKIH